MYQLSFTQQAKGREPFLTRSPSVVVGREDECQLQLAEKGVGDRHAIIERRADGYYVRDLGSANGVRVNGEPISERRLATGDELEFGSVRLRFEIVHAQFDQRRAIDWLRAVATAVVVLLLVGQLALLAWIFSEPRPRGMRLDTAREARARQPVIASAELTAAPATTFQPPHQPSTVPAQGAASAVTAPGAQALNRMIQIVRVTRADSPQGVVLKIQARAQVGERALDASATAICVQFFGVDGSGRSVPLDAPVWLPIPRWENFSQRSFSARFPGTPAQYAGYVVRTYYRRQLQDVAASTPALLSLAPDPLS